MHGRDADLKDRHLDKGTVTQLLPGKSAKITTKISSIHSDIGSVIHDVRSVPSDIRRTAQSLISTKPSEILPQIDPVASEISEIGSDVCARETTGKAWSAECPRGAHKRSAKTACKTRSRANSSRKAAREAHSAAEPSVKSAAEPHPAPEPGTTAKGCGVVCDHKGAESHGDRKSADRSGRHSVPPFDDG